MRIDLAERIPPHEEALLRWIPHRRTIRSGAEGPPPNGADRAALAQHAHDAGARLIILQGDAVRQVAAIAAEADPIRCLQAELRTHVLSELRWSKAEAEETRDGLDVRMLGLPATELPGLLSLKRTAAWELLARQGGAHRPGRAARQIYEQTHNDALVVAPPGSTPAWLELGAACSARGCSPTANPVVGGSHPVMHLARELLCGGGQSH